MTTLPITRMTLYKHGVGFFERRGALEGEEVELTFRLEDMNDVLKSLTAIDQGEGKVLGVEYATPQSREEQLAGSSIRLSDERSLGDLLVSLRGRRLTLLLDQGESCAGVLVGLDAAPEGQPLATALVSLLEAGAARVRSYPLGRLQGLEIEDERGAGDLRFFLRASLSQETHRQVRIRLSPGAHDLAVSYVAPAPTWRVSYRLAVEGKEALLLGWGIFDNRLEEDLEAISLSLVAGMPISFRYELYTPFTPERPQLEEEGRVAAGPVQFAQARRGLGKALAADAGATRSPEPASALSLQALEAATPAAASGQELGELFAYDIETPVTVGRGQSAMVPILSARLACRKDLLYNGRKQADHPVATLRLPNESGLTLERGPATVLDEGHYVGEALLAFTAAGGEIVVPYAVELGVKLREEGGASRETHALRLQGAYLRIEEWDLRWRSYQAHNSTPEAKSLLIEHPRSPHFDLFDTPDPAERGGDYLRFALEVPGRRGASLRVQERRLVARSEALSKQSYEGLQRYLQAGLIDPATHDYVAGLLRLWEQIEAVKGGLGEAESARRKLYEQQTQIQGNMAALGTAGKEGALRGRYVQELSASEDRLQALAAREQELQAELERLQAEVEKRLNVAS